MPENLDRFKFCGFVSLSINNCQPNCQFQSQLFGIAQNKINIYF